MRLIISNFSNFRMVNNIPINDQIHYFQILVQEIHRRGSTLDKNYQVSYLIDKLPLSWTNIRHELRRTQDNLILRSVIYAIRIEDQYRIRKLKENQSKAKVYLAKFQNLEQEIHDIILLSYIKIDNNLIDYLTNKVNKTKILQLSRVIGAYNELSSNENSISVIGDFLKEI